MRSMVAPASFTRGIALAQRELRSAQDDNLGGAVSWLSISGHGAAKRGPAAKGESVLSNRTLMSSAEGSTQATVIASECLERPTTFEPRYLSVGAGNASEARNIVGFEAGSCFRIPHKSLILPPNNAASSGPIKCGGHTAAHQNTGPQVVIRRARDPSRSITGTFNKWYAICE